MKITRAKLASRGHAIKQARQTVDRTLVICDGLCAGHEIFSSNRTAELQAVAVILRRAEDDIWQAYDRTAPALNT